MLLTIPTTLQKYFRLHLELIRSIPPLDTLRYKELDVLSQILYWNYVYKDVPKEDRSRLIFHYDNKIKMSDSIFMELSQFNNCLTSLKKKGVLKDKMAVSDFGVNPDNPVLQVDFKIK